MRALFWWALSLVAPSAKATNVDIIRTPRRNSSTGVVIHKRTRNFIDIEAPVDRVWVGCSKTDPKESISLLGIDIADEDVAYSFYPRRAIHDVPTCLAEEKIYRQIMKDAKTVRVVGVGPNVSESLRTKIYPNDRTPRLFKDKPKIAGGFFVRLQAGDKCKAYFSTDCDLPKNYWAGTIPVE